MVDVVDEDTTTTYPHDLTTDLSPVRPYLVAASNGAPLEMPPLHLTVLEHAAEAEEGPGRGREAGGPPEPSSSLTAIEGSIMHRAIAFKPYFKEPMCSGQKVCTARTTRKGEPGDTFDAFGATFQLMSVTAETLDVVADLWHQEGCTSREHFLAVWNDLYPGTGEGPEPVVFLHRFTQVATRSQLAERDQEIARVKEGLDTADQTG